MKIYRSEFGKEKMKEDDLTGPKELKKVRLNKDGDAEGKLKELNDKGNSVLLHKRTLWYGSLHSSL